MHEDGGIKDVGKAGMDVGREQRSLAVLFRFWSVRFYVLEEQKTSHLTNEAIHGMEELSESERDWSLKSIS